MAEGQNYDPIIEANLETSGINAGRMKNTELAHELAEMQRTGEGDADDVHEGAKSQLARDAVVDAGVVSSVAWQGVGEQEGFVKDRKTTSEVVDRAINRVNEVAGQYDKLQTRAKQTSAVNRMQTSSDKSKDSAH